MFRVLQIANYIVHVALEEGIELTNLHLQKILYYLQAESLVRRDVPLFTGDIEKWRLGPVSPEVYHEYKEYGSQPIDDIATEMVFDDETMKVVHVDFDENDIDNDVRDTITPSIISLLEHDAFDLVDKTHEHTPWSEYRSIIEAGERGLQYTNEEVRDYFLEHPDRLDEVL